MNCNETEANA